MIDNVSKYNADRDFKYEFRESRIKKCISIMENIPPGHMLDIGCSAGTWAEYWMERGWRASGIDINAENIATAQKKGITAKICDLNNDSIPFPDKSFDLVFAGEIIEHLIDTDGFLKEIRRCLRPEGHLMLTTPNLSSFENRLRIVLGYYPIWVNYNLGGSGHVRAYTPRVLKKQLINNGFSIIKHTGNWVPFIPQFILNDIQLPILSVTGSLFPNFAMDIIVLAKKGRVSSCIESTTEIEKS
jgi:2-polyprenyl-3-methyl-5-hydroxy-6-metoxy-1,4-benzoquinol methylase